VEGFCVLGKRVIWRKEHGTGATPGWFRRRNLPFLFPL
jgi:hypothetical protein